MARKGFSKNNPYTTAMKLTKGKSCNRPAVLKAVKAGSTPREAVAQHCGAGKGTAGLHGGAGSGRGLSSRGLRAIENSYGWRLEDPKGGTWWPNVPAATEREVRAAYRRGEGYWKA